MTTGRIPRLLRRSASSSSQFQEDLASLIHHGKVDVVAAVPFTFVRDHRADRGLAGGCESSRRHSVPRAEFLGPRTCRYPGSGGDRARYRPPTPGGLRVPRGCGAAGVFDGASGGVRLQPRSPANRGRQRPRTPTAGRVRRPPSGEPLRLAYAERNQLVGEYLVAELAGSASRWRGSISRTRSSIAASRRPPPISSSSSGPIGSQMLRSFSIHSSAAGIRDRGFGTFNGVALADPEIERSSKTR